MNVVPIRSESPQPHTGGNSDDFSTASCKTYCNGLVRRKENMFEAGEKINLDNGGIIPPVYRPLCAFFEITARLRHPETGDWSYLVTAHDLDGKRVEFVATPEDSTQRGGYRLLFARRNIWTASAKRGVELMADLVMELAAEAPPREAVDQPGWNEDYTAFTLRDGSVEGNKDAAPFFTRADSKTSRSSPQLTRPRYTAFAMARGNPTLLLSIGVALVGPLLRLCGTPGLGVHLAGRSGSGKSMALELAASVWGEPRREVGSFAGTAAAAFEKVYGHNDGFYPIDELGEAKGAGLANFAYGIANGVAPARLQRNGEPRPSRMFKVAVLSAGEVGFQQAIERAGGDSAAGQAARLLDLPAEGSLSGILDNLHGFADVPAFAAEMRRLLSLEYGHLGRRFLKSIINQTDAIADRWHEHLHHFRTTHVPPGASTQVHRAAQSFALIDFALELAIPRIRPWHSAPGEVSGAAAKCFARWVKERGGTEDGEKTRLTRQLCDFINREASRFQQVCDNKSLGDAPNNRAGFVELDSSRNAIRWLLHPGAFRDIAGSIANNAAAQILYAAGHLQTSETTLHRYRYQKRIGGSAQYFYAILPSIFGKEDEGEVTEND